MVIELPRCNFKYCHYCFDGNCHKKTRDMCDYQALKTETERLEQICNSYALQYGTVRDQLPIIKRIGVDAARVIFAAIGSIVRDHATGYIDDNTLYALIHALEKKYTEGENERIH